LRQAYDYWQDQPGFSGEIDTLSGTDLLEATELTAAKNIFCDSSQRKCVIPLLHN